MYVRSYFTYVTLYNLLRLLALDEGLLHAPSPLG